MEYGITMYFSRLTLTSIRAIRADSWTLFSTRRLAVVGLIAVAGLSIGCGSGKLETGYAYTPLGDSPTKRRSYYADPFSPEARVAQQERQADFDARRPVPGN